MIDASRVLVKGSAFIIDNCILPIKKYAHSSPKKHQQQQQQQQPIHSSYLDQQLNKSNATLAPIKPQMIRISSSTLRKATESSSSSTSSPSPSPPTLLPTTARSIKSTQQATTATVEYSTTNVETHSFRDLLRVPTPANSSNLQLDKKRILLKNIPFQIDKEYLELYLEYLCDDNNEIERYDFVIKRSDSLVVTFLKDIDFNRIKRKHANRPKLLNNRIILMQVYLPVAVVFEHVDKYLNPMKTSIDEVLSKDLLLIYLKRRLRDDNLNAKISFDKQNNWALIKFKRYETAKRLATNKMHEIQKKKYRVRLFYENIGPDPFTDPPFIYEKLADFSRSNSKSNLTINVSDKPDKSSTRTTPTKSGDGSNDSGVGHSARNDDESSSTNNGNNNKNREEKSIEIVIEKADVDQKQFVLNQKNDFFNTDIQSIYDDFNLTTYDNNSITSSNDHLNEPIERSVNTASFKSVLTQSVVGDMANVSAHKLLMRGDQLDNESHTAVPIPPTNSSQTHLVPSQIVITHTDFTRSPNHSGVFKRDEEKVEIKVTRSPSSSSKRQEASYSFSVESTSSSSDNDEGRDADISALNNETSKARQQQKQQQQQHKKSKIPKPIVNLPRLSTPQLSYEEYKMLNLYDTKLLTANEHEEKETKKNADKQTNDAKRNSIMIELNVDDDDNEEEEEDEKKNEDDKNLDENQKKSTTKEKPHYNRLSQPITTNVKGKSNLANKSTPVLIAPLSRNTSSRSIVPGGQTIKSEPDKEYFSMRGKPKEARQEPIHLLSQQYFPIRISKPEISKKKIFHENGYPFLDSSFERAMMKEMSSSNTKLNNNANKPTKHSRPVMPKLVQLKIKKSDLLQRSQVNVQNKSRIGPPPPKLVPKKQHQQQQQQQQQSKASNSPKLPTRSLNLIPKDHSTSNKIMPTITLSKVNMMALNNESSNKLSLRELSETINTLPDTYDSTQAVVGGSKVKMVDKSNSRLEQRNSVDYQTSNVERNREREILNRKIARSVYDLKQAEQSGQTRHDERKATKIVTNQYGCVTISQSINRLSPFAIEFFQNTKYLNQLRAAYPRLTINLNTNLKNIYLFGPHQLVKEVKQRIEEDLDTFKELDYPLDNEDLAECLQKPLIKQKLLKFIEPILNKQQQQKQREIINELKKGNEVRSDQNDNFIITAANSISYFCSYYVKKEISNVCNTCSMRATYKLAVCTNFLAIGDLIESYIKSSIKVNHQLRLKSRKLYDTINRSDPTWVNFFAKYQSLINYRLARTTTNESEPDWSLDGLSTIIVNDGLLFSQKCIIELTGFKVDVENFVLDCIKTFITYFLIVYF